MKLKYSIGLFVMGLLVLFAFAQPGATEQEPQKHMKVDFSQSCTECHTEMTPDVVAVWQESRHGETSVKCYVCHGDGEVEFSANGDDERCSGCHGDKVVDFAKAPGDRCFDCHDGHSLKFHQN